MPILHKQITDIYDRAGNSTPLEPKDALYLRGPVIQVSIEIPEVIAQQLLRNGQLVPAPISGFALIDTGATSTCIDDQTAQEMKLPVVNRRKMVSATHSVECNVYPVLLGFTGTPIKVNSIQALGANIDSLGVVALLGRDVLQHIALFYNGPSGQITLSF